MNSTQMPLFCQSCAMPLEKPDDFGSNADGSRNDDYCRYCFQEGKFTEPDLNAKQMIENIERIMKGMKIPGEIIEQTKAIIPSLKRWKK